MSTFIAKKLPRSEEEEGEGSYSQHRRHLTAPKALALLTMNMLYELGPESAALVAWKETIGDKVYIYMPQRFRGVGIPVQTQE